MVFKKVPFFRDSGISPRWFAIILLSKFLVGLLYNWVQKYHYQVGDTFAFFEAGQVLVELFWSDPLEWFKLTFGPSGIPVDSSLLQTVDDLDFWTDPSAYFVVRLNGLFGLISNSSHAVMLSAWQIIPITGLVAIYKVLRDVFE